MERERGRVETRDQEVVWGGEKFGRGEKEREREGTITVEGDHHHIRVFHEKATSGA